MDWRNDINWKVYSVNNKVYIFKEHNWAFGAWEIEKIKNNIKGNALLVHVDSHLDDMPDGVNVRGLFDINSIEDVKKVSQGHDFSTGKTSPNNMMDIANFIWAGIARGTIGETIFISDDSQTPNSLEILREIESNAIDAELTSNECSFILTKLSNSTYSQKLRFNYLKDFFQHFNKKSFLSYANDRPVILDLDLDYFNRSNDCYDADLYPEKQIREELKALRNFFEWDLITVALSPFYCGGVEESNYLLSLFIDEFDLLDESFIEW
ncbi:UPF0489 family protein [Brevibacillus laterosporus]|uniref:UPF0489 family protein n=1 Tax=Brevibacillus laterosporus TaxID=1465 RepID=UPI000B9AD083|nr:UPF0489 family protein [Brevibacillus laterosporus]